MFSKQQEKFWTNRLVRQTRFGSLLVRVSIQGLISGDDHVNVMLVNGHYSNTYRKHVVGIVNFDSELITESRCSPLMVPSPLKINVKVVATTSDGTPTWQDFVQNHAEYRSEWMTDARSLCVYRGPGSIDSWESISIGSVLSMRYLTEVHGMVRQTLATVTSRSREIFLMKLESELRHMIEDKYEDLARLMAGLS